jgi:hypothetical protein
VELPNLSRVVDTYVPVSSTDFTTYLSQLKLDVLPHIRKLQSDKHLRWFSFLLHGARHLAGRESEDGRSFIHLCLEPATELDLEAFKKLLPAHFCKPQPCQLSGIPGLDGSTLCDNDWAHAWKILGEASEWVLYLLEGHKGDLSLQQVIQFLHFITNPLMLGHKCLCIPAGFVSF